MVVCKFFTSCEEERENISGKKESLILKEEKTTEQTPMEWSQWSCACLLALF